MTQTIDNLLEKQSQIDYFYEAALEAFKSKQYEQAYNLASRGLNEARGHPDLQYAQNFEDIIAKVINLTRLENEKLKHQTRIIANSKLIDINGIGPKLENSLEKSGIRSVEELIQKTPEELSELQGIGHKTAEKLLSAGKDLLRESKESENNERTQQSVQTEPQHDLKQNHSTQKNLSEFNLYDIIKDHPLKTQRKTGNDILPDKSHSNSTQNEKKQKKPMAKIPSKEGKHKKGIHRQKHRTKEKPEITQSENESYQTNDPFICREIIDSIKDLNYIKIIPSKSNYEHLNKLDLLLLGEYNTSEDSCTLVIHPIKYIDTEDPLFISSGEAKIRKEGTLDDTIELKDLLTPIKKNIKQDLVHGREVFSKIKSSLYPNLELKRTLTKKGLFFLSENKQINFIIEPIVLSAYEVKSLEKVSLFPYSIKHKVYVIQKEMLRSLLSYLKEKYRAFHLLEDTETTLKKYVSFSREMVKYIRLVSLPFLILGVMLSLFLFLSVNKVVFDIILFPSFVLSSIFFSYCVIQYKIAIKSIKKEFLCPLHSIPMIIDRSGFYLLAEQLKEEYLNQFLFEFKSNIEQKDLEEIEKELLKPSLNSSPAKRISEKYEDESVDLDFKDTNTLMKRFKHFFED
ncbi:MAG: hypothetical protein BAJALOKI2v1_540006 [Promethearchaeota archaeon]|nr:MAG: hypothetical protein BAJALOKI2v1_540006 [Candidatus Lokiarchaeota archaeon]